MSYESIKVWCIDLDGVLTDGRYLVSEDGKITKAFHTRDFYAINVLKKLGYEVYIVTGADDDCGPKKAARVGIPILQGIIDKVAAIEETILQPKKMDWSNVAYIGDAENDVGALERAGLTFAPSDGVKSLPEVNFTTSAKGGEGVVYEVVEWLLEKLGLSFVPMHGLGKKSNR